MLAFRQRCFGIYIFYGSVFFLFILQATFTFSNHVTQQQQPKQDESLAHQLYRRDNAGQTSDSGHDSEIATASVTRSQQGNKLHSIDHNIHGDSDVSDSTETNTPTTASDSHAATSKDGETDANADPFVADQDPSVENDYTHQPWLFFHSDNDAESMGHAMNAEMNNPGEAKMTETESLELGEEGTWFTTTALITGAFNFSSCIYIMIRTWPRANTDSSSKKTNINGNSVGIEPDGCSEKKDNSLISSGAPTSIVGHKETNASIAQQPVSLPSPVRNTNRSNLHAVLPNSTPNLSGSYCANTSATDTVFSDGALSRHQPPFTRKMKRASTFGKAIDAAAKIKGAASRGPWRWSAAAWDLEAYAESAYSSSRSSLATINSVEDEDNSFTLQQPNNTRAEFSSISLAATAVFNTTTTADAGHLSQPNKRESIHPRHHHHHSKHRHVASRHRFALYTTTTDMALTALITGGALYAAIRGQLPDDGWCRALGLASYALIAMDLALVAFESILFWSAVSQLTLPLAQYHAGYKSSPGITEQTVAHHSLQELDKGSSRSLGRYHWKLWLACTVAPWVLSLSLLPAHGFGWDSYWCFVYNHSAGGKGALAFMILLHYTVLLIVSLCYIPVLRAARQLPPSDHPQSLDNNKSATECKDLKSDQQRLHSPYETHSSSANPSSVTFGHTDDALQRRRLRHHRRVVEGAGITLTHLLLQVVHYTPGTLHVAAQFFDYEDLWIYLVAIIFTQSGALMHAFVIGWSEWQESRKERNNNHY